MKRRHEYSQHFLRDPRLVYELVGHSNIKKSDLVYDLGAGSGVISSVLAKRAGRVVAVEQEPRTARTLRANMRRHDNVTVVEGDMMTVDFPESDYKIFANIPFHLSSPLVRRLLSLGVPPRATYVIVQRQFARKLLPNHQGFSSQLGMMIGPWFAVRIRRPLRRTDFWPHPNVDTVLLEIMRRNEPLVSAAERAQYERYIERCFTEPDFFAMHYKQPVKPSSLQLEDWVKLFTASKSTPSVRP